MHPLTTKSSNILLILDLALHYDTLKGHFVNVQVLSIVFVDLEVGVL